MITTKKFKQTVGAAVVGLSLALLAVPVLAQAPAAAGQQAKTPIIVSPEQAQALIASGAKIIDLRSAKAFAEGHIPGAVNLPWVRLNQREIDGVRNEFAEDAVIEKALSAAGLSYADTVLIYDSSALPGRAYTVFDYAGFKKLHVLDGGIGAWKGGLSSEAVTPTPTAFKLTQKNEIRVNKQFVESKVGQAGVTIIDGRDAAAYLDGHIPTAKSLPSSDWLASDKSLKPQQALNQWLGEQQINSEDQIVSYCGSGVAAANNYLALRNLGYDNVAFYDASWDEWSRDPKSAQSIAFNNYTFNAGAHHTGQTTTDGIPIAGAVSGVPQFLDIAAVRKAAEDSNTVIVDIRSPADYDWGHIPNAVNVFWDDTFNADRTLKSNDELAAIYKKAGVTPDKRVVIYARGGYQLTHTYTALSLLGYKNIDFFTAKFDGWKSN